MYPVRLDFTLRPSDTTGHVLRHERRVWGDCSPTDWDAFCFDPHRALRFGLFSFTRPDIDPVG